MRESTSRIPKICYAVRLDRIEYGRALALQQEICRLKKEGFAPDVLLLLEHPPVITLGRNGRWHNLVGTDEMLRSRGVSRFETDRGGDITFHGPGQLVGYPLLELESGERDVHRYMRNLEETVIRLLADFGIAATREEGLTGVWTTAGKICAMGVHISRWITRHGFALNVNTDLSYYDLIVPCGLAGRRVASMASVLSRPVDFDNVTGRLAEHFGEVFEREMAWMSGQMLERQIAEVAEIKQQRTEKIHQ